VETYKEALNIHRELDRDDPKKYRKELVNTLNGLRLSLEALGYHEEATATHEEVVSYRFEENSVDR